MDEDGITKETTTYLSVDNKENSNDNSENKENFTATGILKIGQLKDDRKYDSNTEDEK